jgi:NADP-dependent 3-hydroxy acid dehydrogenase YdfG
MGYMWRQEKDEESGRVAEKLNGAVALITGASSGIGEATAQLLAAQGAVVAVIARRKDRLDRLADVIARDGGKALVIESDVTDQAQAQSAVERTVAELGRLDMVINNAGVMLLGPAVGAPLEEWDQMVKLNVQGVLYIAHAALPHLLSAAEDSPRQVADLVNISSVAGRVSRNGSGVYAASKFAVVAFSESLRQELAGRHVRVSVVEPGVVATELQSHIRAEVRERSMQRFAGVEPLQAEDIADVIQFIVTRPRRMAINEMLLRPSEQEA